MNCLQVQEKTFTATTTTNVEGVQEETIVTQEIKKQSRLLPATEGSEARTQVSEFWVWDHLRTGTLEREVNYIGQVTLINRYTQREFKCKFSALLEAYDVKFAENSTNMTFKNNFSL